MDKDKKVFDISKPKPKTGKAALKPKSTDNIAPKKTMVTSDPAAPVTSTTPGDTPIIVRREGVKLQPISDSGGETISVTKKPAAYKAAPEEIAMAVEESEEAHTDALTKPETTSAAPVFPTSEVADKPKTVAGMKTIEPITPSEEPAKTETTAPVETSSEQENGSGEELTGEATATTTETPEPAPAAGVPDETKLNEHKSKDQATTAEMEKPKVYDTKEYNLPIAGHKRHSHGKTTMIFLLLVLLLAVGFVAAIDAEMLDVGFQLPFDLL